MSDDRRIQTLVDRAEIAELVARYCDRLDGYDIDGVARTFTEDARTDYGPGRGGPVIGRAAIHTRIARGQAAFRRTHHQVGHHTIEVDGDSASGVVAALTWHERHDGTTELLALRYLDEYRRVDDQWLIAARRVEISIVEGFAGTEWNWWPRAAPESSG